MELSPKAETLIGLSTTFYLLAIASVIARLYVRTKLTSSFGADDAFAIAALVGFTGQWVSEILLSRAGFGKNPSEITMEEFMDVGRYYFIGTLFFIFGTALPKISFSLTLARISTRTWQNRTLYGIIAIVSIYTIMLFFVLLFNCHPVQFFWNRQLNGSCISSIATLALVYTHAGIIAMSDVFLAVVSVTIMKHTSLPRRIRVSILVLLLLGTSAALATVARIPTIVKLNENRTGVTFGVIVSSLVELGLSIIVINAAVSRPLIVKWFPCFELGEESSEDASHNDHIQHRRYTLESKPDDEKGLRPSEDTRRSNCRENNDLNITRDGSGEK